MTPPHNILMQFTNLISQKTHFL